MTAHNILRFEYTMILDKLTSFIRPKSTLNLWRSSLWCFARLRNSSFSFFHGRRYSKSWICKNKHQRLHSNVLNRSKNQLRGQPCRQNLLNTYNHDNCGSLYILVPFHHIIEHVPLCYIERRYVWYMGMESINTDQFLLYSHICCSLTVLSFMGLTAPIIT